MRTQGLVDLEAQIQMSALKAVARLSQQMCKIELQHLQTRATAGLASHCSFINTMKPKRVLNKQQVTTKRHLVLNECLSCHKTVGL